MKKCPVCKVGDLLLSEVYQSCDKCNFTKFEISDNYIQNCCKIIALLLQNTQFRTYQDFEDIVASLVKVHTPMLDNWIQTITIGRMPMWSDIRNEIRNHAINLQILDLPRKVDERDDTD